MIAEKEARMWLELKRPVYQAVRWRGEWQRGWGRCIGRGEAWLHAMLRAGPQPSIALCSRFPLEHLLPPPWSLDLGPLEGSS